MLRREYSNNEIRRIDDNTYRFVASDESVDRHHTSIKAAGWMLENFARNPIALYNHNSGSDDPSNVIGKWKVWIENGVLMGDLSFAPEDVNPKVKMIKGLIDFGALNAVSVGFNPQEWTKGKTENGEDPKVLYFRKQDLLEISVVDIPSNPNAIKNDYDQFVEMAFEDEGIDVTVTIETNETPTPDNNLRDRYMRMRLNSLSI